MEIKNISLNDVISDLNSLGEESVRKTHQKLIFDSPRVIGIRTPNLRHYAKMIVKQYSTEEILNFIKTTKLHQYQELDYLISFLICLVNIETKERIELLDWYSYTITNWASCDMAVEKSTFKKSDVPFLWEFVKKLMIYNNDFPYRNRFGCVLIMSYFTDLKYYNEIIAMIEKFQYGDYYLDMGVSWLLSVLLVKHFDLTFQYLQENNNLNEFTFKKSLQKAIESFRVSETHKDLCRELKKRGKK